jgi:hypothetical protein
VALTEMFIAKKKEEENVFIGDDLERLVMFFVTS